MTMSTTATFRPYAVPSTSRIGTNHVQEHRRTGSGGVVTTLPINTQGFALPYKIEINDVNLMIIGSTVTHCTKGIDTYTQKQTSGALNHVEKLNLIKASFDLNITQLSEALGVTRKAVYDWYEGTEPRESTRSRLTALIKLVDDYKSQLDLTHLKYYWATPFNGESFLSIFTTASSVGNAVYPLLENKLKALAPHLQSSAERRILKTSVGAKNSHVTDIERST